MLWTCEQIEERLTEYLDRLLSPGERQEFAAHVVGCARCRPLVAQVGGLVSEMHRLEPVEAPAGLVYAILERTLGPRTEKKGWRAWLGWLQPAFQPRLAMGIATVLLSVVILSQALGFAPARLTWSDLAPASLYRAADRRAHLIYGRGVKFVNDLRVVYEIQSRLRPAAETEPAREPEAAPAPPASQPKSRRESNRANPLSANLSTLACAMGGVPGRSLR